MTYVTVTPVAIIDTEDKIYMEWFLFTSVILSTCLTYINTHLQVKIDPLSINNILTENIVHD